MDEEALRKEITVRLQAEFEAKLREVRRQKSLVEEDLEAVTERSRTDRRRLNAEIDRLEEALSAVKRVPSSGGDSKEIQQAYEEKLRQVQADWQIERERLSSEVSRLEGAFTEAISRSSNPNRITQAVRDAYEIRLAEANSRQLEAEQEFMRTRGIWEDEKRKLTAEMITLRRAVPAGAPSASSAVRAGSIEEVRIRELEGQLSESRNATGKYHAAAMKSAHELIQVRREVLDLNSALLEIREKVAVGNNDQFLNDGLVQELAGGQPRPGAVPSGTVLPPAAEITRVRAAIAEIEKLFDDPNTLRSTIARKNIEKAELEAYLRGVLFSVAVGKDAS